MSSSSVVPGLTSRDAPVEQRYLSQAWRMPVVLRGWRFRTPVHGVGDCASQGGEPKQVLCYALQLQRPYSLLSLASGQL